MAVTEGNNGGHHGLMGLTLTLDLELDFRECQGHGDGFGLVKGK